jgi:multicomponent Na+:H+ antiporter subunit G
MIVAVIAAVSAVLGAGFMALAGLGILRMPDLFTRMHASTKGASLGVALLLLAAAAWFGDLSVTTKALLTTTFVFLTAPVAAHLLGRAAYAKKIPLWEKSLIDEARGKLGEAEGPDAPDRPASGRSPTGEA